ncbi:MAG: hypothetical protein IH958_06390 [Chloroflexi bacterium]|nr:hypothetical protein [Chloroflexota bacterium]
MEGLWILLGSVLSLTSGVIFWFLNAQTTREAQTQQQEYDAKMLERRLQEDRAVKKHESLRVAKQARLQPIFDALTELDMYLGPRMILRDGASKKLNEILAEHDNTDLVIKLCARLAGYSYRIEAPDLREKIFDLAKAAIGLSDDEMEWLEKNIADVYALLEASVVDQQTAVKEQTQQADAP